MIQNPLTLKIANIQVMFVILIATIIRLQYFAPQEKVSASGKVYTEKVRPMFVLTTLFVLPALLTLFILVELNLKRDWWHRQCPVLEKPISKGLYLVMVGLMFTEVEGVTEVIFCLIICLVGLLNVAIGIVNETVSTRQPVIEVQKVPMTSSQQSVAQNYQIDGEESHIVSTAKHHANRGTSPI